MPLDRPPHKGSLGAVTIQRRQLSYRDSVEASLRCQPHENSGVRPEENWSPCEPAASRVSGKNQTSLGRVVTLRTTCPKACGGRCHNRRYPRLAIRGTFGRMSGCVGLPQTPCDTTPITLGSRSPTRLLVKIYQPHRYDVYRSWGYPGGEHHTGGSLIGADVGGSGRRTGQFAGLPPAHRCAAGPYLADRIAGRPRDALPDPPRASY